MRVDGPPVSLCGFTWQRAGLHACGPGCTHSLADVGQEDELLGSPADQRCDRPSGPRAGPPNVRADGRPNGAEIMTQETVSNEGDEPGAVPVSTFGSARDSGRFRWLHEVNLWRDPTLPSLLFKILLLAGVAPAVLVLAVETFEGSPVQGFQVAAQIYLIVTGVLMLLFVLSYPVFILFKGGRYPILFEMDDREVRHIEMPSSADRSRLMAWVGLIAGLAARNPTVMGSSLLALSRSQMATRFRDVRKVVVYRRRGVMRLIARDMTRNLIYVDREHFQEVVDHVLARCPRETRIIHR